MAAPTAAIPFSEPPWLLGLPSPIFKPTHYAWQRAIRVFITEHLYTHALEWEKSSTVPAHVFEVGHFLSQPTTPPRTTEDPSIEIPQENSQDAFFF